MRQGGISSELIVVCLLRHMEGTGRLESLEHFNVFFNHFDHYGLCFRP